MPLCEIPIGFDNTQAQIIADVCATAGVQGELLVFDETRYEIGRPGAVENRFLVDEADEDAARAIIGDLFANAAPLDAARTRPSLAKKAVAVVLLASTFGGVVVVAVTILVRVTTGL